ncbi:MAG: hypothetical protein RIQ46_354 [Pseudomonadota bacterium]|jgi:uncharacterized integral membrane protein
MRMIRTLVWIVITAVLVAFIAMNWHRADVNFWPAESGNYAHFQWPVGFIALFFFLLGLLPMWLLSKAGKWRLTRRISALENSVKAVSMGAAPPLGTTTQLEAEAPAQTGETRTES